MNKKLFLLFTLVIPVFALDCNRAPAVATKGILNDSIHVATPAVVTTFMRGEAPSLFVDGGIIHISFASGDSIFYTYSNDKGKSYSAPAFVAFLKGVVNAGGRGPQIVGSNRQLLIAAPDKSGNFYTWLKKNPESNWTKGARINDMDNTAKEGFITLTAGESDNLFAVWLDLRERSGNNIYGAVSLDGGTTWMKNHLIYKSPDGSVCECCKPFVAMKGQQVSVMFRNNLKGNRDLYLIQSKDRGETFGIAEKLGEGSWKINGCPMDGGGLVIDDNAAVQTVWRREGDIYTARPGEKEVLVCKGMKCMITGINGSYYIAFVNEGKVYCRKPGGKTIELGPGNSYPKLIAIDNTVILCAWENDKRIYRSVIN